MARINREEYQILKSLDNKRKWIADEKPYNIAELIQEYEVENGMRYDFGKIKVVDIDTSKLATHNGYIYVKESEEAEVKSKQELIEKWESAIEAAEFYGKGKEERLISYMKDFVSDLSQLDESEVFSPDWIRDNVEYAHYMTPRGTYSSAKAVIDPDKLKNLLVPEMELPVIPQFVADWIEGNKQFEEKWNDYSKEDAMNDTIHFTIYGLFADYPATNSDVELRKPVLKWLSVDRGNYFKLVNAVRYGYQVEEEQKYRVVDRHEIHLLAKEEGHNKVETVAELVEIYGHEYVELDYNLTEQEIKDYDERYWPFRKPVEEL